MPRSRAWLLLQLSLIGAFCLASLCSLSATATDEELILLTIEGHLIGKLESLDEANDAALIINAYYDFLPEAVHTEIEALRLQLSELIPDYEVAFTAADSAELVNVMDDFDVRWTVIRTIHAQNFTLEVVEILNKAYGDFYSLIE